MAKFLSPICQLSGCKDADNKEMSERQIAWKGGIHSDTCADRIKRSYLKSASTDFGYGNDVAIDANFLFCNCSWEVIMSH